MGEVPQDEGILQNGQLHQNQRKKLPVGSWIHPIWFLNSSGKCVLKFSCMKKQEPYHLIELKI